MYLLLCYANYLHFFTEQKISTYRFRIDTRIQQEESLLYFFFWLYNWNIRHICSYTNYLHFFNWLWTGTVDCPLVYCIFSCAGIMLNRCAIVLSIIAWKIGILHHCLVIVAFPCKLIFEISNMCLTNALLIGMLQEATYLWEDDDDRLVALVYDLMLASVQFNRWYCCSFQNLFDMDWWDTLDFTQTLRVNF